MPSRTLTKHARALVGTMGMITVSAAGSELQEGSFEDSLARVFSSKVRLADKRLVALQDKLSLLPSLDWVHRSPRHGFHSSQGFEQEAPEWLQVDLEGIYPIDMIAVMAADVESPLASEEAYAFPLRFKIEASLEEDMSDAVIIADETMEDFPNPGRFPVVYEQAGHQARYIRFTSFKHTATRDGDFIWALGELMILSGDRNIALNRPVSASSQGLQLGPSWMLMAVNDGHSSAGTPVSGRRSPTFGYRSSPAESNLAVRWVTVDLGETHALTEVRLVPAWPSEVAYEAGMGFPRSFKVVLSDDLSFRKSVELPVRARVANPRNNPYSIDAQGQKGRYLRIEASRLWKHGDLRVFALAEVEAYAGEENVALGKRVIVSDVPEGGDFERWAPEYLVDGHSSRAELVAWRHYFRSLDERQKLEREQSGLVLKRDAIALGVADGVIMAGSGVAGVTMVALLAVVVRQRAVRRRDRVKLREQIARDLHDELGSNLGSISLLSELGSRLNGLPAEVLADFSEIHKTAERSAEAMRDIVWLIDSGSSTLRELVAKMREAAERLVGDNLQLRVTPEYMEDHELALLFRRHTLFSFKESLNNVRRHAAAFQVNVTIDCSGGALRFKIQDDGVGFRVDERTGLGNGLLNLRKRAKSLHGTCEIDSQPEGGTTILFEAPLKSRNHGGIS